MVEEERIDSEQPVEQQKQETGQEEPQVEIPEKNPNANWFAVHTYSGYENRVRESLLNVVRSSPKLRQQILQILIPTEEVAEIREGKKKVSSKKLFPGYVVIEMELNDETRTIVRNTPGVTGFVGPRRTPVALTPDEVDRIVKRMTETDEKPRLKVVFEVGERVKVIEGPFFNFSGYVSEINEDRGRVTVMVDILGRSTPVELDFLQVEKV